MNSATCSTQKLYGLRFDWNSGFSNFDARKHIRTAHYDNRCATLRTAVHMATHYIPSECFFI